MPVTYRVRIRTVSCAPPETAAVRLIALLPARWAGTLLGCTEDAVALALTPPGISSSDEVASVVDEVLANSVMRGWIREGITE